ncbi:MAG: hypothetical protein ACOH1L_01160 [Thermomonas sp.]
MPASAGATTTNEGTAHRLDDGVAAYREMHLIDGRTGQRSGAGEIEAARSLPLTGKCGT